MPPELLWWFAPTGLEGTGTPPRASASAPRPSGTAASRIATLTATAPRPQGTASAPRPTLTATAPRPR